jgi:hypothetical protein
VIIRGRRAFGRWVCLLAALLWVCAPVAFAQDVPSTVAAMEDADEMAADLSAEADGADETAETAVAQTSESDIGNIVELGTVYSAVQTEDGVDTVLTSTLTLGGVSSAHALAVVWAPGTGKVALRKSASAKGTFIKDCAAGTLVAVLLLAGEYTKVNYLGKEGYLRTDCLRFYPAAPQEAPTGFLSYNGHTNGATTVNIRLEGNRESRKIGVYQTGTPLTVVTPGEIWTEIELKGQRGFVMTKYVTVSEDPGTAPAPEE